MIRDAYGRPLSTLRVAVTEKCNFKCIFCHSEGLLEAKDELTLLDFKVVAEATARLGMKYVKFTGGEPLLRPDIQLIIRVFSERGFEDISMTTNGFLLYLKARELARAGLKWVNVSLHSLKEDRFERITGVRALRNVLKGIEEAQKAGLEVRLNVVVLKGINEDEIKDIIKFGIERGMSLHVIELHPVGKGAAVFGAYHSSDTMKELRKWLEQASERRGLRPLHNRPRYYFGKAFVELVEPVGNPFFCSGCTRLRLSPDGRFYPCINVSNIFYNALPALRSELTFEEKVEKVMEGILNLNDMRRPYYMWNIDFERKSELPRRTLFNRIDVPKRAKLQFSRRTGISGTSREAELCDSALRA